MGVQPVLLVEVRLVVWIELLILRREPEEAFFADVVVAVRYSSASVMQSAA